MFCWICTANFKVGVDSKGIATVTMDFQGMKARKMNKTIHTHANLWITF